MYFFSLGGIPESDGGIFAAGEELSFIFRELEVVDFALVSAEDFTYFRVMARPEEAVALAIPGGDEFAIFGDIDGKHGVFMFFEGE